MKTNNNQITKTHLLDYVTKFEFNEFRDEMKDFRVEVQDRFAKVENGINSIDQRFVSVDKRIDTLDRKFDQLREDFRVHTSTLLQEFQTRTDTIMEYLRYLDAKKVDKESY